ncbi:MAG: prepilin-type N-terminal cleavage/methylation domain-containing protein [Bacilli bacterium]|nr:prepilin-type N-terminal cleavage/methylation domain-containing protein [Bacilli bacterium]
MKKKGFTLVELLLVIVIIGLIALIVYPSILRIIGDARTSSYENQVKIVEKAARAWGYKNALLLPDGSGSTDKEKYGCLKLSVLTSGGYLSVDEVKDPRTTGKNLTGAVRISYSSGQYVYEYVDELNDLISNDSRCTVYN